ncbi:hypothetical protein AB0395_21610 [Streptosporangium sp. NPDC051023]|uniref:hypothetical protein n=1 Tax=Streptosporangium sp. NPDC051023 TaxID=3155410 RepID=UPI00344DB4BD
MRFTVPDSRADDQIIPIFHDLGTRDVAVTCYAPDGQEVGYVAAIPTSFAEVEIVVVPGSDISEIEIIPAAK